MDPLLPFVFGGLFSPGPNIILLTISGARFGFRATVPHLLGVAVGVGVIAAVAGLGVAAAVMALPALAIALRLLAAGWILWLAWSLLNAQARPEAARAAADLDSCAGDDARQAARWGHRPRDATHGVRDVTGAGRPFTFWQAVLFQWVNPKVWAVAIAAAAGFPADLPPVAEALRLGGVFSGLNLFVCLFWTWAGSLLTFLLDTPRAWRAFMGVMALVLAGSAAMILV